MDTRDELLKYMFSIGLNCHAEPYDLCAGVSTSMFYANAYTFIILNAMSRICHICLFEYRHIPVHIAAH